MGNNLKPVQSKEEARRRGRNGGIKSGEVRRQKKTLKSQLLLALSDDETRAAVCNGLISKAAAGDARAFAILRDSVGESPSLRAEIRAETAQYLGADFVCGLTDEQAGELWSATIDGGYDGLSLDAKRVLFERMLTGETEDD